MADTVPFECDSPRQIEYIAGMLLSAHGGLSDGGAGTGA
jgi:hypothetical protein